MGSVEQTEQFPRDGAQRSSVESDGDRLVIDRMKNTETTVGHGGGFGWISREFPVKGPILSPPAANVLSQVWSCIDPFCIGIFQRPAVGSSSGARFERHR